MKTLPGLMVTPLVLALCFLGTPTVLNAHGGDTSLIHACVKQSNGALRIIAADGACKKTETALDWSISGTAGPQGPQGPQGPTGPRGPQGVHGPTGPAAPAPLAVYDANDKQVGDLVGMQGNPLLPIVAMTAEDVSFALLVRQDMFAESLPGQGGTFYESSDCSGQAFIRTASGTPSPIVAIAGVNQTVHVGNPNDTSTTILAQSGMGQGTGCQVNQGSPPPITGVIPAVRSIDLVPMFTPPFSVR